MAGGSGGAALCSYARFFGEWVFRGSMFLKFMCDNDFRLCVGRMLVMQIMQGAGEVVTCKLVSGGGPESRLVARLSAQVLNFFLIWVSLAFGTKEVVILARSSLAT